MSNPKIAVGYVRCSTELQEDSPEQQKKEILAFAERNGHSIIEWFVDFGISGTTFEQRPEFQRLKRKVEHHPRFEAVICYDESRWGRAIHSEDNTYFRRHFERHGVQVLLVKTAIDPNHEYAPMLKAFEGIQASQYSKKLSELTLRGAKSNGIYSSGGTAPYGYKRIAVNTKTGVEHELHHGEWSVPGQEKVKWGIGEADEVDIVRHIFDVRSRGIAYIVIAKELNDGHIACPRRGRWRNRDQKWSTVTIKTIIENPAYRGARVYNRLSMSKIQAEQRGREVNQKVKEYWRNDPSEWVVVEDAHPAIVDKDLWDKANSHRRPPGNKGNNGHTYRSRYLLTGLIKCSRCGFAFQGWSGRADGREYLRYIDGGWQSKRVCSHLGIDKDLLESFAIQSVKETLSEPTFIKCVEQELKALQENGPSNRLRERQRLLRQIAEVDGRIGYLTAAIERGKAVDTLLDCLERVEAEKRDLRRSLTQVDSTAEQQAEIMNYGKQVADFILNFEANFERAPIEERKLLMQKVISEIVVDRDQNVVRFYVRRVPAVSPALEGLLENKRALTEPVSARSSGGRT